MNVKNVCLHQVNEFGSPFESICSFHLLLEEDHLSLLSPYEIHSLSPTTNILLHIVSISNSFSPRAFHPSTIATLEHIANVVPYEIGKKWTQTTHSPSPSDKISGSKAERSQTPIASRTRSKDCICSYTRLVYTMQMSMKSSHNNQNQQPTDFACYSRIKPFQTVIRFVQYHAVALLIPTLPLTSLRLRNLCIV